jgi:hypothetical protein
MKKLLAIVAACATVGAFLMCNGDDNGGPGPVQPQTQVRVVNDLSGVNVSPDTTVDSVVIYGLSVEGVAIGNVGPGDTSISVVLGADDTLVTFTADSLLVYIRDASGPGQPVARTITISTVVTEQVALDALTGNTVSIDNTVLPLQPLLIVGQTQVRVSNQYVDFTVQGTLGSIQVDSVHAHGLQVGNVTFGTVKAGDVTTYQTTTQSGSVQLTASSLVIYAATCQGSCVTGSVGPVSVTINDLQSNTILIDNSVIDITSYVDTGGSTGDTKVKISNALRNAVVESDTVDSMELYGVRVAGIDFGNVFTGQTTAALDVSPQGGTVTVAVDSVIWQWQSCIMPGVCVPYETKMCVNNFQLNVTSGVTNTIEFSGSDAATTALWNALILCP